MDFRHGDGIKFLPAINQLKVQGVGHVQVRAHRALPEGAVLGQVSVKREGSGRRTRWLVVIPVQVQPSPLPTTGAVVLTAKAEKTGRELIAVNPANTSRTCPNCGHCAKGNRPTQAVFTCQQCSFTGHADTVGAINILRAGTALHQTAHAA